MRAARILPVVVLLISGCSGTGKEVGSVGETAAAESVLPSGPDPCALVSQAEMETLLGPLAEPPFRVDSQRRPKADGEGCFYRALDRRNVTVAVDWEDGEMAFQMMAGTGQAITDILTGYDPATDTLEGNWDKVGAAFGQFLVLKGKTSIQVDPLGSRLGLDGAARVADLAMRRLERPLDYSGARATLARSEDAVRVRNPCELVTRSEAEALMGPLRGDPKPSDDNSECDYVTSEEIFGSPITRTMKVTWNDGFYSFGQERMGVAGATKVMATHMDTDLPSLSEEGAGGDEPWDERMTLVGGLITVVKGDVALQLNGEGVGGFDEKKALAMLRIAVRRL